MGVIVMVVVCVAVRVAVEVTVNEWVLDGVNVGDITVVCVLESVDV